MADDVYLWQDAHDPDWFSLGVKTRNFTTYTAWCSLVRDSILELFGKEAEKQLRQRIKGGVLTEPIHVSLKLEFVE